MHDVADDPTLPAEALAHGHTPWARLGALLRWEAADLRALVAFAAAAGILGLMTPLMVQVVVNTVAFGALRQSLFVTTGLLLASLLAGISLQLVERFLVEQVQRRLMVRFATDLAARLPRFRRDALHGLHPTEIVNRFFDVLTVQKSLAGLLVDGLDSVLQALFGLTLLALYHPALLGYSVLLVALFGATMFVPVRRATATSVDESKAKHAVAGWLEEIAANPEVLRTPAGRAWANGRADVLSHAWLAVRAQHFRIFLGQSGGALVLTAIASAGLLALGGSLVIEQQLSLGQLVAAELVVTRLLLTLAKLTDKLESAYDLVAALDKLGHVLEIGRIDESGAEFPPVSAPASIDLLGIQLTSGAAPIHLSVPAGDEVALLAGGELIARKLSDVLCGAEAPVHGRVHFDQSPLADRSFSAVRRDVWLLRTPELFSGSVLENLTLGVDRFTTAEARAALDRARLPHHDALRLDEDPGANGADLPDEVRISLAVARAVLHAPRMIVLDRLLDAVAPAEAQAMLRALHDPRWTLIVLTRSPALAASLPRAFALDTASFLPIGARS
jgi:putative ABC transport system ATP-binding protein